MNTDYFAQQIALDVKAGLVQSDLASVKATLTTAASLGKKKATVFTKFPLSEKLLDELGTYGIGYIDRSDLDDDRFGYTFNFEGVKVRPC